MLNTKSVALQGMCLLACATIVLGVSNAKVCRMAGSKCRKQCGDNELSLWDCCSDRQCCFPCPPEGPCHLLGPDEPMPTNPVCPTECANITCADGFRSIVETKSCHIKIHFKDILLWIISCCVIDEYSLTPWLFG